MPTQLSALRKQPYLLSMSAPQFVRHLQTLAAAGKCYFPIGDIEVVGSVELSAIDLPAGLVLERVYFLDAVKMGNRTFAGHVQFRACAFDKGLDLSHAKFKYGIAFFNCDFGISRVDIGLAVLRLQRAHIEGDITFFATQLNGCLSARGLTLVGDIIFTGSTVEGKTGATEVALIDLRNSEICGDVVLEADNASNNGPQSPSSTIKRLNSVFSSWLPRSAFIDRSAFPVSLSLAHSKVAGDVNLAYAKYVGEITLLGLNCHALISGGGFFRCRDDEVAQWLTGTERDTVGGAEIDGNLVLSGGDFKLVRLSGIIVSGLIVLIDGRSGQIEIDDWARIVQSDFYIVPAQAGGFVMSAWHCRDYVHINLAKVTDCENDWEVSGIQIKASQIDRDLIFRPGGTTQENLRAYLDANSAGEPRIFARNAPGQLLAPIKKSPASLRLINRWFRRQEINGRLIIERCTIGGDLDLTGIDVRGQKDPIRGQIKIIDTTIEGALKFRSLVSYLAETPDNDTLIRLAKYILILNLTAQQWDEWLTLKLPAPFIKQLADKYLPRRRRALSNPAINPLMVTASCDSVDMRRLVAAQVDLSGLHIRAPGPGHTIGEARIDLDYAHIHRELLAFSRLDNEALRTTLKELKEMLVEGSEQKLLNQQAALVAQFTQEKRFLQIYFDTADIAALAERLKRFDDGDATLNPAHAVEAHLLVPGALDLQHAVIGGEIKISDAAFRMPSSKPRATERGIVFDFAKIRKLYVARSAPDNSATTRHNGFPVPISLLDIDVDSWFLEEEPFSTIESDDVYLHRETTKAGPFLDLLDNDAQFRMSSYSIIERSLRNRGLDDQAKKVFVAARYRDVHTGVQHGSHKKDTGPLQALRRFVNRERWRKWRPGDGRYREHADLLPFWRLRRPLREVVGALFCVAWCAAVLYVGGYLLLLEPTRLRLWLMLFGTIALGPLLLGKALLLFVDRLYWSLLDYGTSAMRLAAVIVLLMFISFLFVAGEPRNFEPSIAAEALALEKQNHLSVLHSGQRSTEAAHSETATFPSTSEWGFSERLWTTLHYHVPLASVVVADEWQAADKPLHVAGIADDSITPTAWPKARDWFATMQWLNWILWPLFLPFLIRRLRRDP